jgi:hypothetical protein
LADNAIILHATQRKGADRTEILHSHAERMREAVAEIASLTYKTLLRIVWKTNGGLR